MLQEERYEKILEKLAEKGVVKSMELSEMLNVSESTIRRDINELRDMGKLKKVFGGAVPVKKNIHTEEEDITSKAAVHVAEKDAIGKYAAGLIKDNDLVFIDAGTTTERMLDHLDNRTAIYMTNGITHAKILAQRGFKVNVIGGTVKAATLAIVGITAVKAIENFNFTKCFIGANGIDLEKGITTPDPDEAMIKNEVIKHSSEAYILADSSKFDQIFAVTFAKPDEACIITDKLINSLYKKQGSVREAK